MDGSLGSVVGGGHGEGEESEAGGDGHNGGLRLIFKVCQESGGKADGADQVGGDDGYRVGRDRYEQVVRIFSGRMMPALWTTTLSDWVGLRRAGRRHRG